MLVFVLVLVLGIIFNPACVLVFVLLPVLGLICIPTFMLVFLLVQVPVLVLWILAPYLPSLHIIWPPPSYKEPI